MKNLRMKKIKPFKLENTDTLKQFHDLENFIKSGKCNKKCEFRDTCLRADIHWVNCWDEERLEVGTRCDKFIGICEWNEILNKKMLPTLF